MWVVSALMRSRSAARSSTPSRLNLAHTTFHPMKNGYSHGHGTHRYRRPRRNGGVRRGTPQNQQTSVAPSDIQGLGESQSSLLCRRLRVAVAGGFGAGRLVHRILAALDGSGTDEVPSVSRTECLLLHDRQRPASTVWRWRVRSRARGTASRNSRFPAAQVGAASVRRGPRDPTLRPHLVRYGRPPADCRAPPSRARPGLRRGHRPLPEALGGTARSIPTAWQRPRCRGCRRSTPTRKVPRRPPPDGSVQQARLNTLPVITIGL
ncbi:hypothetical protein EV641_105249 [Rhodococcus sp. SMB37]|nr:hypothetical protein EV641_105249 [Rhodococcus sp. SMB37]